MWSNGKRVSSLKYQIMKVSMLTTNLKISHIATMFLAVSFLTATAQTLITVTTDKTSYSDGDTITISGTAIEQLNIPISIIIKDHSQHVVYIAQTNLDSHNAYSTQVTAGGDLWKTDGTYEIDITYGGPDRIAKTTFEFTSNPQSVTNTGNQTNATQAIPEFGPLSASIFAISILTTIALYAKARSSLKI